MLAALNLLADAGYSCKRSSMSVRCLILHYTLSFTFKSAYFFSWVIFLTGVFVSLHSSRLYPCCSLNFETFAQDTYCLQLRPPRAPGKVAAGGPAFSLDLLVDFEMVTLHKPENVRLGVVLLAFCCQHSLTLEDCDVLLPYVEQRVRKPGWGESVVTDVDVRTRQSVFADVDIRTRQ